MAEGNGIDLGSVAAMLTNLVVGQESLRAGLDSVRGEVGSLRAGQENLAQQLYQFRAEARAEFADLRQTIELYHSSVMGHGIAMTELQEQAARINDHIGLSPAAE